MNPLYPQVAARAGHRCEYCRAPEAIFNPGFEVEHVVPVSRGGQDDENNRALACRACNLFKADSLTGTDESTNADVRLFNPRQDAWDEHFRAEVERGLIQGVTPVGRAAVMRLQLNRSLSAAARQRWARLGLFP